MADWELRGRIVDHALSSAQRGDSLDGILDQALTIADEALPSHAWAAIRDVDHSRDVRGLGEWISQRLSEDAPDDLSAIWFGLYELAGFDLSREGTEAVLRLSGGPGFPHQPDWLDDQTWYPDGYAPTPGLRSLLPIAASGGQEVFGLASYAIVFSYSLGLVVDAFGEVDPASVLLRWPRLGVAMGFHDGDIAEVGVLMRSGLDRSRMRWL